MQKGFDNDKYVDLQSRYILERVEQSEKLYLEFGGKLFGDLHAMRVLPGFDPDAKIKILQELREQAEIIICIYAGDIAENKIREDYGISYEDEVLRMIDEFRSRQLSVNSVVVTRYSENKAVQLFKSRLERRNIKVYLHEATQGYPLDVDIIVSESGYGQNEYIQTDKKLVVVTAPGPNSGKLGICLSQLYHEIARGKKAGYAKFETFPVWNLPLKHPVNVAYEAATADLLDVNMIDPYHLEAYGEYAINYNRDVEAFPLVRRILNKIFDGESPYKSPTDMGVNQVGNCIIDDEVVKDAANQEIIRRYLHTASAYRRGTTGEEPYQRTKLLMDEMQLTEEDRIVVKPAREYANQLKEERPDLYPEDKTPRVTALELPNGQIVTGKGSKQMSSISAAIINAIKVMTGLADPIHLLSPVVLEPVHYLKEDILGQRENSLSALEILLTLSISAATNPMAREALDSLRTLRRCQAHSTVLLNKNDEEICSQLGIEHTSDPVFGANTLFY